MVSALGDMGGIVAVAGSLLNRFNASSNECVVLDDESSNQGMSCNIGECEPTPSVLWVEKGTILYTGNSLSS